MGRGVWQAIVYGVAKSWTRLSGLSAGAPRARARPGADLELRRPAWKLTRSFLPHPSRLAREQAPAGGRAGGRPAGRPACLPAGRPASLPPSLPSLPPLSPSLPSPACWELLRFQAGRGTQHRPARSAQGPAGSPALGLRYGAQTHGRKAPPPPPTPHPHTRLCSGGELRGSPVWRALSRHTHGGKTRWLAGWLAGWLAVEPPLPEPGAGGQAGSQAGPGTPIPLRAALAPLFPHSSVGKETACNAGDLGSIPGLGRSPGEGKGYPLQYSGLENSVDCIVHGNFLTME